ncbi:hypothetical protein LP419_19750 [Massilia sp. H-1]|nr:hypothetical protein LP419_19750 [Massilia sp. H-1]
MRTLTRGNPRCLLAVVLIAASLCVLDLFAGHVASERARMEYQAVIGERLGHLAIVRANTSGAPRTSAMFEPEEALRVIRLAEANPGVALVVPQMSVEGIASTGERSALFFGEGIVSAPDQAMRRAALAGQTQSGRGQWHCRQQRPGEIARLVAGQQRHADRHHAGRPRPGPGRPGGRHLQQSRRTPDRATSAAVAVRHGANTAGHGTHRAHCGLSVRAAACGRTLSKP